MTFEVLPSEATHTVNITIHDCLATRSSYLTTLTPSSTPVSGALEEPESGVEGMVLEVPGPPHENVRCGVGLSILVRSVPPPTAYEGCHSAE
jgi:hypothetical protein